MERGRGLIEDYHLKESDPDYEELQRLREVYGKEEPGGAE
jgi:hypothetical protein